MIGIIVKDLEKTLKEIKSESLRTRKAAELATRVEGYRLIGLLKQELRQGRAGGMKFSPLTEIAKRLGKGGRNREPLSRLALAVRYNASRMGDAYMVNVGFVDAGRRTISKSWKRIAEVQQAGGRVAISRGLRAAILDVGARLRKRRERDAKYFFLRPETTEFQVKPRPIIEPFIAMHRRQAEANIVRNFERKMAGERI